MGSGVEEGLQESPGNLDHRKSLHEYLSKSLLHCKAQEGVKTYEKSVSVR